MCICFNTLWIPPPPSSDISPAFSLFPVHTSTIADLVFLESRRLWRILINCSGAAVSTHVRKQTHTVSDYFSDSATHICTRNSQRMQRNSISPLRTREGGGKLEGTAGACNNIAESEDCRTLWTLQQSTETLLQHVSPPFYFIFAPETLTGFKRKNLYTVFDLNVSQNGLKLPRTHDQEPGTLQSVVETQASWDMEYLIIHPPWEEEDNYM